jgi:hypothetical protein
MLKRLVGYCNGPLGVDLMHAIRCGGIAYEPPAAIVAFEVDLDYSFTYFVERIIIKNAHVI